MYICIITNNINDYSLGYFFNWTINKIVIYIPRLLSVSFVFQAVLSNVFLSVTCCTPSSLFAPTFKPRLRLPLSR